MDMRADVLPPAPGDDPWDVLICRVYTDDRAWEQLRPCWDALLACSDGATPWQSWQFLSAWWRHLAGDRELRIVVVERRARPCLILPLQLTVDRIAGLRIRCLEPIGMPDDINRPRLAIGPFDPGAYRAALNALWRRRGEWQLLRIDERPPQGNELRLLDEFAEEQRLRLHCLPLHSCPYLSLNRSWPEYLRGRSARLRKNLRNARHRLESIGKVKLEIFDTPDRIGAGFDVMMGIHERSWKYSEGVGIGRSEASRRFFRSLVIELAAEQRARVLVLYGGDIPVAGTFALMDEATYYSAAIAHDSRFSFCSPGTLLEALELEMLMNESHYASYDFLGAALNNKLRWTSATRQTVRTWLFSPSLRTRLVEWLYFGVKPVVQRMRARLAADLAKLPGKRGWPPSEVPAAERPRGPESRPRAVHH
jgi:CelD/BcsL family acetyltransferase involved in cellulose biosynthesis